jgi:CubicO group peptidase (beta-lactamase class C family)
MRSRELFISPTAIHGHCAARFEPVREAFAQNLARDLEHGASVAVAVDGRLVVDLWGGFADAARRREWQRDTLVNVYSTTKGLTALCAHLLAERGALELDAPVARYWPEFAQAGKQRVRVRHLLCHQAGLAGLRRDLPVEDLYDWKTTTTALAAEAPWWEPGTAHGYHALTFGHLVGEVVRRISGKSLGTFFRDEVARPLGADLHIGLAAEHDGRVAELIPPPVDPLFQAALTRDPTSLLARALANPSPDPRLTATRAWRGAEIPAANGHGNARSIARVYAALARGGTLDGVALCRPETLERASTVAASGPDLVLQMPMHWGLGYAINASKALYGPNPRSYGHTGYGGSFGFADPEARLAVGYAMNRMAGTLVGEPRGAALIAAAYASL